MNNVILLTYLHVPHYFFYLSGNILNILATASTESLTTPVLYAFQGLAN